MKRTLIAALIAAAVICDGATYKDTLAAYWAKMGVTSVANPTAYTNLVAWWKFDEGTGTTTADSAWTNTGTLVNTPIWTNAVPSVSFSDPYSLGFNGSNQYVNTSISANFNLLTSATSPWTVCMWVNPTLATRMVLLAKDKNFDSGEILFELSNDKVLAPQVLIAKVNYASAWSVSNSVPTNAWSHVLFRYNGNGFVTGTNLTIYVNGAETSYSGRESSGAITTFTTTNNLRIAAMSQGVYYYKGQIDDVRIYNRALTTNEISIIAGGGL